MKPTQALSDAELDELDDFLLSDDTPENCMDISALDGFFAALVLNPRLIMPSEYLSWIWDMEEGEEVPSFASVEQANHIMQLVMRYYNSVLDEIGRDNFAPLFYISAQEDGGFDAECWCEGFMRGVFLFRESWTSVFEKHPEFLSPMVLLGTEHGWEMLDNSRDVKRTTQEAYESIAGAVTLLYGHFGEQREAREVQPSGVRVEVISAASFTTGRNEKCPCGSGKKFEECCGAAPTLH